MNYNIKNNKKIYILVVIIIFVFYKGFPKSIQVFIPLILGIYFAFNICILIYQRRYWEEILRSFILFIATIILFINYYNFILNFNSSFMKIALLTIGWTFPCLAYTSLVSWKRIGELDKYRKSKFLLVYCIILAMFCTIVVIVK